MSKSLLFLLYFRKKSLELKLIEIPLCLPMQEKIFQESNFLVIPDKEDGNAVIINKATGVFLSSDSIFVIGKKCLFQRFLNRK